MDVFGFDNMTFGSLRKVRHLSSRLQTLARR
jgi:hypothetical protein